MSSLSPKLLFDLTSLIDISITLIYFKFDLYVSCRSKSETKASLFVIKMKTINFQK